MTQLLRLKNRSDFLAIAGRDRRWVTRGFILQGDPPSSEEMGETPENPADSIWVGFTVSKKVGNAVARNRLRRRLRAVVQDHLTESAKPGWRFVLVGRASEHEIPFDQLVGDLGWAIRKLQSGADLKSKRPNQGKDKRSSAGRGSKKRPKPDTISKPKQSENGRD